MDTKHKQYGDLSWWAPYQRVISHWARQSADPPCEAPTIRFGLWPSKNKLFYLLQWNSFKNDEKYFLFYLKSCFRSKDI